MLDNAPRSCLLFHAHRTLLFSHSDLPAGQRGAPGRASFVPGPELTLRQLAGALRSWWREQVRAWRRAAKCSYASGPSLRAFALSLPDACRPGDIPTLNPSLSPHQPYPQPNPSQPPLSPCVLQQHAQGLQDLSLLPGGTAPPEAQYRVWFRAIDVRLRAGTPSLLQVRAVLRVWSFPGGAFLGCLVGWSSWTAGL